MKTSPHGLVRVIQCMACVACMVMLSGCAGLFCRIPQDPQAACAGDRCSIDNAQFVLADQLFSQYGSLSLVDRDLREVREWRDCEVNEAIYRLRKIHGLP